MGEVTTAVAVLLVAAPHVDLWNADSCGISCRWVGSLVSVPHARGERLKHVVVSETYSNYFNLSYVTVSYEIINPRCACATGLQLLCVCVCVFS